MKGTENSSSPDPFSYYKRLRRVKAFVEERYTEKITAAAAADEAALEKTYFSTYFHKKSGKPFSRWLREFRVEKAKELLRSGDHSVTEVAFAVGFGDLRSFGRAFKSCEGLTPVVFRQSMVPRPIQRDKRVSPHVNRNSRCRFDRPMLINRAESSNCTTSAV